MSLPLLRFGALALAATLAACVQPTTPRTDSTSAGSVDAHVARATQLAGTDLKHLLRLCQPQPADRAAPSAAMDEGLRKLIAKPAPPATQVFDNLYFVG